MTTSVRYSLLDEPLMTARLVDGQRIQLSLPALFVALAEDGIRDFPALRPHQRHPWHAFLVQLAAIALHQAGRSEPFADEADWRSALLALTPDDPDGAPWCLIAPPERPALLQAPVPEGDLSAWKGRLARLRLFALRFCSIRRILPSVCAQAPGFSDQPV
jgi:CRISPR system Cascade subunit CasA